MKHVGSTRKYSLKDNRETDIRETATDIRRNKDATLKTMSDARKYGGFL